MSTISDRFFVTAIEDGTNVAAELRSTQPLRQSVSNSGIVPNWETDVASQPTVFCIARNGGVVTVPNAGKWLYNDMELTFDETTHLSTNTGYVGVFQETTHTYTVGQTNYSMPAVKIVKNLGSANNVDMDVISYHGQIVVSNTSLNFDVSLPIAITELKASGYQGVLLFDTTNGRGTSITSKTGNGSSVRILAKMYNNAAQYTGQHTCKWFLNESSTPFKTTTGTSEAAHYADVTEAMVTDYAVLRCEWYDTASTPNLLCSAFIGIDDEQDPEKLWISYGTGSGIANGNSASLRKDESVEFVVWVGKQSDPTSVDTAYTTFSAKLLDAEGQPLASTTFNDGDSSTNASGIIDITDSQNANHGKIRLTWYDANNAGGNITGIVIAQ